MAEIRLDAIAHAYVHNPLDEAHWALKSLEHTWENGSAYAVLGPSGCGKTTLLNIISGLVHPARGRLHFDGIDVTDLPTERRNIAQVFQFPVIYDTMSVYDNLAFPLRNRGVDQSAVDSRVKEIAAMLELGGLLGKRARGMSADAKQKISLGRGLVRSDVAAILFDEPLTVIDPNLKWHLRRKLKEIHERFHLTLIYVTHDQNEALTFASKVAVMHEGRVMQIGTPRELFEAPAHRFVGYFIGSPGMNFLSCGIDGDGLLVDGRHLEIEPAVRRKLADSSALELGVRPEFIRFVAPGRPGTFPVEVRRVEDLGHFRIVTGRLGAHEIKIKVPEGQPVPEQRCAVAFAPRRVLVYASGRLVG